MADDALKAALRKARTTPMNFVIVSKGVAILGMIVRKKPIKPAEGTRLKSEKKASEVIAGTCAGESGGLLFRCDVDKVPFADVKLKSFISEEAGLTVNVSTAAVPGLAPIDEDDLDLKAFQESLSDALAAVGGRVNTLIGKRPDLKTDLIARVGEVKRLIQEIDAARPERVADAKAKLAALFKEVRKYGADGAVDAGAQPHDATRTKPKSSDVDDAQRDALKTAFIAAVLKDDASQWSNFHKYFSASTQKELASAFGGARGLTAVGKLLRDVCGGDPKRLRALSDAMD